MTEASVSAPLLEGRGISVRRGSRVVLEAVDLSVATGEVVALVGPNGAGKSTLLAALAGSMPLESGDVILAGGDLENLTELEQARRRSVLPQDHTVGMPFSCREIVAMGRYTWARTDAGADDDERVAEAMESCAVTEFADRAFGSLSGGERARVALARVLAQDCPVVLLDEPTAALDLRYQELVLTLLREQAAAGRAVVVVIHDLSLAAAYADRIALLSGGRMVRVGPVAEVLDAALLSEVYGLPLQVSAIDGRVVIVPLRKPVADSGAGTIQ